MARVTPAQSDEIRRPPTSNVRPPTIRTAVSTTACCIGVGAMARQHATGILTGPPRRSRTAVLQPITIIIIVTMVVNTFMCRSCHAQQYIGEGGTDPTELIHPFNTYSSE